MLTSYQTGLGTDWDQATGRQYRPGCSLSVSQIEALMSSESLIYNAVKSSIDDIIRAWRGVKDKSDEFKMPDDWIELERKLDYQTVVDEALTFADTYGGAVLLPRYDLNDVTGLDMANPVDIENVSSRYELLGWRVFTMHEFIPEHAYKMTESKLLGDFPEVWEVKISGSNYRPKIHKDWMTIVKGMKTPRHSANRNHFGQSKINMFYSHFERLLSVLQNTDSIIAKAVVDVFGAAGLAEKIKQCAGDPKKLQTVLSQVSSRVAVTGHMASNQTPIVMDNETESYVRTEVGNGLTGVVKAAELFMILYASAVKMPRTKLYGEAAKGLNNGGEENTRDYYDTVDSDRNNRVLKLLNRMDIISSGYDGLEIPNWSFGSLWQMTEKEQADCDKIESEIDKTYYDMGIVGVESGIAQRISDRYCIDDDLVQEARITDTPRDET